MAKVVVSVTALVAALVVARCGSTRGTKTDPRQAASTTTEFIAKADAICKAGNEALAPVRTIKEGTSDVSAEQMLQTASGSVGVAVDELAALTPPRPLAEAWSAYMSAVKQEQTLVSGMADAISSEDTATLELDIKRSGEAGKESKQALAGKGFSHCGQGR
jgi:hypothetical protein